MTSSLFGTRSFLITLLRRNPAKLYAIQWYSRFKSPLIPFGSELLYLRTSYHTMVQKVFNFRANSRRESPSSRKYSPSLTPTKTISLHLSRRLHWYIPMKAKSLLLVFLSLCLCFSLCSSADTNEREQNDALNNEFSDLESDEFSFAYLRHRKLEEVNIFQKLKESLGAAIVGFILIIFMPCLIWKNEGRHVRGTLSPSTCFEIVLQCTRIHKSSNRCLFVHCTTELSRIEFCKNKAVVVNCMEPTDETSEQLVYFCGNVLVDDEQITFPETDTLNLASALPKGLMLKRTCYIYQKFEDSQQSTEKHIGGGETRTTNYSLRGVYNAGLLWH